MKKIIVMLFASILLASCGSDSPSCSEDQAHRVRNFLGSNSQSLQLNSTLKRSFDPAMIECQLLHSRSIVSLRLACLIQVKKEFKLDELTSKFQGSHLSGSLNTLLLFLPIATKYSNGFFSSLRHKSELDSS